MPRVSLIDKNLHAELNENDILFDGLDNQGIKLSHGCLAGSCGACRIEIISGKENISPPSAIEQNTLKAIYKEYENSANANKEIRLACRCKVLGNIEIKSIK